MRVVVVGHPQFLFPDAGVQAYLDFDLMAPNLHSLVDDHLGAILDALEVPRRDRNALVAGIDPERVAVPDVDPCPGDGRAGRGGGVRRACSAAYG